MKNPTDIGMNRTGMATSPMDSAEMIDGATFRPETQTGSYQELMQTRIDAIREALAVGTLPPPASVKGVASMGMQKIKGHHPELLLDKLGERAAFERSGTRLYDSFLIKCRALDSDSMGIPISQVQAIRDEEHRHFQLVRDAVITLGADPTAQTPCADISGVASMGLMQVMNDPRTSLGQCLQMILIAELVDNDGWNLLIRLTQKLGLKKMSDDFIEALQNENLHLQQVRSWSTLLFVDQESDRKAG